MAIIKKKLLQMLEGKKDYEKNNGCILYRFYIYIDTICGFIIDPEPFT